MSNNFDTILDENLDKKKEFESVKSKKLLSNIIEDKLSEDNLEYSNDIDKIHSPKSIKSLYNSNENIMSNNNVICSAGNSDKKNEIQSPKSIKSIILLTNNNENIMSNKNVKCSPENSDKKNEIQSPKSIKSIKLLTNNNDIVSLKDDSHKRRKSILQVDLMKEMKYIPPEVKLNKGHSKNISSNLSKKKKKTLKNDIRVKFLKWFQQSIKLVFTEKSAIIVQNYIRKKINNEKDINYSSSIKLYLIKNPGNLKSKMMYSIEKYSYALDGKMKNIKVFLAKVKEKINLFILRKVRMKYHNLGDKLMLLSIKKVNNSITKYAYLANLFKFILKSCFKNLINGFKYHISILFLKKTKNLHKAIMSPIKKQMELFIKNFQEEWMKQKEEKARKIINLTISILQLTFTTKKEIYFRLWKSLSLTNRLQKSIKKIQIQYRRWIRYFKLKKFLEYPRITIIKMVNILVNRSIRLVWNSIKDELKRRTMIKFFFHLKNIKNSLLKDFFINYKGFHIYRSRLMFNSVNRVIRVYRRFVERIRYRISLKIRFTLKLAIDKSEYFRKLIFNKFFKKWKQVITNTIINQSAQKIQKFCSKTVLILRRTQKQIAFEKLRNLIIAHLIYKQILPFFKVFSISEKINLANNHFKSFIFKHLMKNIINFDKSKLMWRLLRIPDSLNKKHLRKALKQFHSFILKSQMNDSVCKIQKQYRKKLNSKVNYKKFKVLSNRLSQLNDKYSELKRYIFLRWIRLKNRRLIEKSSRKIYNFLSVRWIKLKIKRKLSDLVCKYFVKYDEDRKNKLVNNIKRYLENNMINNCTKIQKYLKFYQILNHIIDRKLMMKNFIIFKELYKLTRLKKILEKILYRNFINRLITKNNFLLKMCKVFQSLDQYTNKIIFW